MYQILTVVLWVGGSANLEAAAVYPYHDRLFPFACFVGFPYVQVQAVLALAIFACGVARSLEWCFSIVICLVDSFVRGNVYGCLPAQVANGLFTNKGNALVCNYILCLLADKGAVDTFYG